MKIAKFVTTLLAGALIALPAFAVELKIGLAGRCRRRWTRHSRAPSSAASSTPRCATSWSTCRPT